MKTIAIETETRPLAEWLPKAGSDDIMCLTLDGRVRFFLVPLDEGDEEVLAIQKNTKLMAYLAERIQAARQGPTKTLAQIKVELGLDSAASNELQS